MKKLFSKLKLAWLLLSSDRFIIVITRKGLIHNSIDTNVRIAKTACNYINEEVEKAIQKKSLELDQDEFVSFAQSVINNN